jgi:hypothetical protein
MDHENRKHEPTLLLPSLGWLLLTEEERQQLQAYIELALTRQFEEVRDIQDQPSGRAEDGYKAELRKSSQLRESV